MYSRMIFATDLGPQSLYIAEQALALSRLCQGELLLLHVVEPPLADISDFSQREKMIQQKQKSAKQSLDDLGLQLGLTKAQQFLSLGEGQAEILRVAFDKQCDLIVVGSHGIGGYTHALGSTAQYIITHAHCNVLVVQVSHLKDIIEKRAPKSTAHAWQIPEISSGKLFEGPTFGSKKGFGEEVKRGPRLSPRPKGAPYRGGTRQENDDDHSDDES